MSIIALKKVTVCGLSDDKESVLEGLQGLGCLHLVSLRTALTKPEKAAPDRPETAYKALKFLSDSPNQRFQIRADDNFNMAECVDRVLQIQQSLRDVSDRRDSLQARIKDVTPWGDFKLPQEDALDGYKLWFYIVPIGNLKLLPEQNLVWQVVHKGSLQAHVVVVAKTEPCVDVIPFERTHTGKLSLRELHAQLEESELELQDLQAERESMTRWIYLLTQNLDSAENKAKLMHASEMTLDSHDVFAVQGWLPADALIRVNTFSEQHGLAVFVEDPRPEDKPPTLLENPQNLSAGEDLVKFYQTPGYWDWDPAVPVFFSFAVFFAMIISDAGYAALLGFILFVNWQILGRSETGRRMRVLALTLILSSVIWGILVGSYFGTAPPSESLLGYCKILDVNDFDTMMRLSVCIGVLHLTFANLCRAWRLRREGHTWLVPLGWVLIMFGGLYVWFAQALDEPADWISRTGKWHAGIGFALVFLFSSTRALRKPLDIILRILDGLKGLSNISQIFGDVLSYLRLFALGLASASLALTFNNLALQAREVEGLGLLFSLLILIIGHGLNILLSLMSAVVHGMRLNCIEFFNWGLSDEGYPFNTFSKKENSE